MDPSLDRRERKKVTPETAATTAECQDLILSCLHFGRSMFRLNSRIVSVRDGCGAWGVGEGGKGVEGGGADCREISVAVGDGM